MKFKLSYQISGQPKAERDFDTAEQAKSEQIRLMRDVPMDGYSFEEAPTIEGFDEFFDEVEK